MCLGFGPSLPIRKQLMPHVSINGFELHYVEQGKGTPLLCVHGFPLSHAMWREQLRELSCSFRVIAPDLRGFGQSTLGHLPSDQLSMEQLADDLAELLTALNISEPIILCGLSMGGYVAWQFARKHRGRLKALIQCDTRALADTPEGVANRQRLAALVLDKGSEVIASAMLPVLFSTITTEKQPATIAQMRDIIHSTSPATIAAALRGMAARLDVRDWLPMCDLPTLLICGVDDKISTVSEMREIAAALPQSRFVVVPDAGHMAPLENPAFVNAAILNEFRHRA